MFNVKMRSSVGGIKGCGGRHISGAERIVTDDDIEDVLISFYRRARNHERGNPDFINIKIQKIDQSKIMTCGLLNVYSRSSSSKSQGRQIAREELLKIGVTELAVEKGFFALESLEDSMRGAMVLSATTGKRLDKMEERGVRCSNMDCADKRAYKEKLDSLGLKGDHAREALILASKVASAPGTVAELCWSDDPDYVTGYVGSSKLGYCRISVMKDKGDPVGGRIFFVRDGIDMEDYIDYLQNQVVLVSTDNKF